MTDQVHSELEELTKVDEDPTPEPTGDGSDAAGGEPTDPERDEPAKEPEKGPDTVPIAALLDERSKRQDLEERLARLENASREEAPEPPDPNEDPEGAMQHLRTELSQSSTARFINLSRAWMKRQHDDYDEREAQFAELAKTDPSLVRKMLDSDDPAHFAYQTAVEHDRLKEIGNLDEWRDKERARIRAELEVEMKGPGGGKPPPKLPPSLTRETEAGGGHVTPTDEALEDILGR